jgi:hypothetical protein
MAPSEDFGGGDRELFKECDAKPDELLLLRVVSMAVKTKIRENSDPIFYFAVRISSVCLACQKSLLILVTKK